MSMGSKIEFVLVEGLFSVCIELLWLVGLRPIFGIHLGLFSSNAVLLEHQAEAGVRGSELLIGSVTSEMGTGMTASVGLHCTLAVGTSSWVMVS